MARPRKNGDEKRTLIVYVRVTASERKRLDDAAREAGMTLSNFLRLKAIEVQPQTRKPTPERSALIRGLAELGKIGSNVNQVARALNRLQLGNGGREIPVELVIQTVSRADALIHHLTGLLGYGD